MDLFLALTENHVHEVLWTDELLDEWERVITRNHKRSRASAAAITDAVRDWFPELRIDPDSYRHLVPEMPGPDPNDHAHSAAAVAAHVDALVTWDTRGFPAAELEALGVRVIDPDSYLVEVYDESPAEVVATITDLARSKQSPPMSGHDIVTALEGAGLSLFPSLVRPRL